MINTQKPIVLILTVGISPAVITEMIYAIYQYQLGFIQSIKIITTQTGRVKLASLVEMNPKTQQIGPLFHLAAELGVDYREILFSEKDMLVPTNKKGIPLDDILNREDDLAFAELTNNVVREACNNRDVSVIACQAGGRKTMGSHLHAAMQLYGRKQDTMYHVLVDEPYESCPDFYYPTQTTVWVKPRNATVSVDASKAKIHLIDIPFLRLRSYLEETLTSIDFNQEYSTVLQSIENYLSEQSALPLRRIIFSIGDRSIYLNKVSEKNQLDLPAKEFAFLCFLAVLKKSPALPNQINMIEFETNLQFQMIWHFIYHSCSGYDIEKDSFFDLKQEQGYNSNLWSRTKSGLKKTLHGKLKTMINSENKPIQQSEIWIDESVPGNKKASTAYCSLVSNAGTIQFVNCKVNQLRQYIDMLFRKSVQAKRAQQSKKSLLANYTELELEEFIQKAVEVYLGIVS